MLKVIAFDCFGTVFDMSNVSRGAIQSYVKHVRSENFTPYQFGDQWWEIKAHPDSAEGIKRLQQAGFVCVTLSNGDALLLGAVSGQSGIVWDRIIDLAFHRAYKPNNLDAYRTVEKETGFKPGETLMVTANPTFGDVEGAAAVGMPSQVIRTGEGNPATIIELAAKLGC